MPEKDYGVLGDFKRRRRGEGGGGGGGRDDEIKPCLESESVYKRRSQYLKEDVVVKSEPTFKVARMTENGAPAVG